MIDVYLCTNLKAQCSIFWLSVLMILSGLSVAQSAMVDIKDRYKQLGDRLASRQQALSSAGEAMHRHQGDLRSLLDWIENYEKGLQVYRVLLANEQDARSKLGKLRVSPTLYYFFILFGYLLTIFLLADFLVFRSQIHYVNRIMLTILTKKIQ